MQSGSNAFGDMSATINTLQNQIRIFQGSLANLRLALGDAIAEPVRKALVYINGFIIAITDIIRAFVPMKTTTDSARDGFDEITSSAEETSDAIDEVNGNLADFDKFNVLGGDSSSFLGGDTTITEALTQELLKQKEIYDQQLQAVQNINNQATQIAEKIKEWFINIDENGIVSFTTNAKLLFTILTYLILLPISKWFTNLFTAIITATKGLNSFATVSKIVANTGLFAIASSIVLIITEWDKMNNLTKALTISLGALGVAMILFSNLSKTQVLQVIASMIISFKTLTTWQKLASLGFSAIGIAIGAGLMAWFDTFDSKTKTIVGTITALVAVLATATAAWLAYHGAMTLGVAIPVILSSVAIGIAGIKALVDGVQGFANGGITDANLIMTHENGVREWVGKQGNSTAVVNDTQMTDVMSNAVQLGVLKALSQSSSGNSTDLNNNINIYIGGNKVFNEIRKVAKQNGYDFVRV